MSALSGTLRALLCTSCVWALRGAEAAELEEPSPWNVITGLETSVGYKDNLLLSSVADEQSAFARGEVEVSLLRLWVPRLHYSAFLTAERTHYFSGRSFDHDANAWLSTEAGYKFSDRWKVTLPVTGYYSDDVFDVSETEAERAVAEFEVWGGMVGPTLRMQVLRRGWVEVQAQGERKRYDDGANDSRIGEGRLRVGWKFGRMELILSGGRRWRDFDHRAQYSSSGRERIGTILKVEEREAEIRGNVQWDQDEAWSTSTRVRLMDYRDNGTGYFDFRRGRLAQVLVWKREPWMLRVEGSADRQEYLVQTLGVGISPPARIRENFAAEVRVERRISARWTAVGEYAWERSRSNDRVASYRVNEGLLGVRWNWEK